jgi:hypothetical protein
MHGGKVYNVSFINMYLRYTSMTLLRVKSDTAHNYNIKVMDVEGAFLHTNLMEEVYIHQLKGFNDHKQPKKVWCLLKSLYICKQAPFKWNQAINSHLRANSFEPIKADPCIYINRVDSLVVFIVLYMDNCTIIGHNDLTKQTLSVKCMMKDLREAKSLLGAEILHNWVNRTISQPTGPHQTMASTMTRDRIHYFPRCSAILTTLAMSRVGN